MKSLFSNMYESFANTAKIEDVLHDSNKLKSGFFYSIIQTSNTTKKFNCNPICICIGPSDVDRDCINVIDLCYMPKNLRYKFVELFFNVYADQINDRLSGSDRFNDVSNFNIRVIQSFLKIFNISNAITRVRLGDVKKISVIDFIDIASIIDDIDSHDNFINTTMKEQQVRTIKKITG